MRNETKITKQKEITAEKWECIFDNADSGSN